MSLFLLTFFATNNDIAHRRQNRTNANSIPLSPLSHPHLYPPVPLRQVGEGSWVYDLPVETGDDANSGVVRETSLGNGLDISSVPQTDISSSNVYSKSGLVSSLNFDSETGNLGVRPRGNIDDLSHHEEIVDEQIKELISSQSEEKQSETEETDRQNDLRRVRMEIWYEAQYEREYTILPRPSPSPAMPGLPTLDEDMGRRLTPLPLPASGKGPITRSVHVHSSAQEAAQRANTLRREAEAESEIEQRQQAGEIEQAGSGLGNKFTTLDLSVLGGLKDNARIGVVPSSRTTIQTNLPIKATPKPNPNRRSSIPDDAGDLRNGAPKHSWDEALIVCWDGRGERRERRNAVDGGERRDWNSYTEWDGESKGKRRGKTAEIELEVRGRPKVR